MKRIITLAVVAIFGAITLQAAEKPVDLDYNRSGLSFVIMQHGDDLDHAIGKSLIDRLHNMQRFDINPLDEKYFHVNAKRDIKVNYKVSRKYKNFKKRRNEAINQVVINSSAPKEVISNCFMYDRKSGDISIERILERGEYNATDRDYHVAAATRRGISELGEQGFELLMHNYIVAIDMIFVSKITNGYKARALASLYKVTYNEDIHNAIDAVFLAEGAEQRAALFDAIPFSAEFITSSEYETVDYPSREDAISVAVGVPVNSILSGFIIKAPVEDVDPIRAKVGSKERLLKNDLFYSYDVVYNEKSQSERVIRTGVVRATEIADNKTTTINNKGESPSSSFYQIAGVSDIKPGQVLVEKRDWSSTISLGTSSMDKVYFLYDILLEMDTNGRAWYGMISVGYNNYKDVDMWWGEASDVSATRWGIGYGWGFRPFNRFVEFVPYFMFGSSALGIDTPDYIENTNVKSGTYSRSYCMWLAGELGVKLNVNVAYPLQLYADVSYVALPLYFSLETTFGEVCNRIAASHPNKYVARRGLVGGLGVRYSF